MEGFITLLEEDLIVFGSNLETRDHRVVHLEITINLHIVRHRENNLEVCA